MWLRHVGLSDAICAAYCDAVGDDPPTVMGANARRHDVPLKDRCNYAYNRNAMFLKSYVRRETWRPSGRLLASAPIVKSVDSQYHFSA